jgi:trans-aconitate 2-methyltransferase
LDWSSDQYRRFEAQRSRPAADLVARIDTDGVVSAVDLGCGPGNSTEILAARYPEASIVGIDTSEDMLAAARARLPDVRFRREDIAGWQPDAPVDVILANASLQWVPDHARLFPALFAALSPGGTLAVQMPDNLDEPTHALMRQVAADGPWRDRMEGVEGDRADRHPAAWYHAILSGVGAHSVDIWRTTYHHPLAGSAAVVDWLKGTGLRPFLARLRPEETDDFLDRYHTAIAEAYPPLAGGTVLLPFPRLFVLAAR